MAGDWIKVQHALPDKPEVVQMAAILGIDQDAVTGKILRLWIWADQQSENGNALSVTESFLDRVTFATGFAQALRDVGWLDGEDGDLSLPNFDRHNGKTAKTRANGQQRTQLSRSRNGASVTGSSPKALPEKRREEKSKKKTTSSKKFNPLTVELPEVLRTGEASTAWQAWVRHRQEKRSALTQSTVQKQITLLASAGSAGACAMIDQSIENGWTGLFEVKNDRQNTGKTSTTAQRVEQANADAFASLTFADDD